MNHILPLEQLQYVLWFCFRYLQPTDTIMMLNVCTLWFTTLTNFNTVHSNLCPLTNPKLALSLVRTTCTNRNMTYQLFPETWWRAIDLKTYTETFFATYDPVRWNHLCLPTKEQLEIHRISELSGAHYAQYIVINSCQTPPKHHPNTTGFETLLQVIW